MCIRDRFFGAQARRKIFSKLNSAISTPSQLHLAVLAAICGSKDIKPNSIIKSVILGGVDMESNEVYQNIVNYNADDAFWKLVKQASGYFEGEDSSLDNMVTHIMLTATTRTLRSEYLAGLDGFISTPHQAWCYDFVSEWIAVDNRDDLFEILRNIEDKLMLSNRFKKVPLEDLLGTEIFPCIDECILMQIMNQITNHIICLLYTSPSPRDKRQSRMPSSA